MDKLLYNRIALVGIEPEEYDIIQANYQGHIVWHQAIPKILIKDGTLLMEKQTGVGMLPIDKVVYYGIYENDFDFITGLALWGGDCFPNALGMMDCRLKIPCLVKAMQYSRFSSPRGFISEDTEMDTQTDTVAKWGNWHCGENKHRFSGYWKSEEASVIEPFFSGEAVRIMIIGTEAWQIKLEGATWLKSIHPDEACFMPVDPELLEDSKQLMEKLRMDMIGNDYILGDNGTKYLLEVNHIPNITRFESVRLTYLHTVIAWIKK
ncbi:MULTISPECIES: hypothetical protein [unclassified Flavobacterium]|uniref:hypothetical protein n=1 Tax=unclassified Flavobacterium TaxID=196869 RepID=UPI000966C47D|nr:MULTISPECIES: hypothetical protein [unclassified Flavobacterium]MBN9284453.1 hypothetical protein [Flavobacterium sp.]OJV72751.1 MAG: hypothetical protein BGO42_15095 [Flavobacterium sp. 40-81]